MNWACRKSCSYCKSNKNKEGKRAYDMVDEIYPSLHISKRKKEKLKKLLE